MNDYCCIVVIAIVVIMKYLWMYSQMMLLVYVTSLEIRVSVGQRYYEKR